MSREGGCAWLGYSQGPRAGVWSTPQHKMYLWKLTVGVISTARVEGKEEGSDFSAPRSPGGKSRRRPIRRGGSEPRLCGENACYALSLGLTHSPVARGWHIESLPPGHRGGEQSSPSTCLGKLGLESLLASGLFPGSSLPPVPGTLGKVHPLTCSTSGQALPGTQVTPLDALNPKPLPEERVGNSFPLPAPTLLQQGSEGKGLGSA